MIAGSQRNMPEAELLLRTLEPSASSAQVEATPENLSCGEVLVLAASGLSAHPALNRLGIEPTIHQLFQRERADSDLTTAIIEITDKNYVVSNYASWRLARKRGVRVRCLKLTMTEEEALRHIIKLERLQAWMSHFSRAELALELEPDFRAHARENQCNGGRLKGSSKLEEAKRIDTLNRLASLAGVSTGTMDKVKKVLKNGSKGLIRAARHQEISIHRAATLSKLSHARKEAEITSKQFSSASRIRAAVERAKATNLDSSRTPLLEFRKILQNVRSFEQFYFLGPLIDEMLVQLEASVNDTKHDAGAK